MSIPSNRETGIVPITENRLYDMLGALRDGLRQEIRNEMAETANGCWREGQKVTEDLSRKISAQTGKFNQLAIVCEEKTKELGAKFQQEKTEMVENFSKEKAEIIEKFEQEKAEAAEKFASQDAKINRQEATWRAEKYDLLGKMSTVQNTCETLAKEKAEADSKINKMSEISKLQDDLLEAQKRSKTAENNATLAELEWKMASAKANGYQAEAEAAEANPEMDEEAKKAARERAQTHQARADEAKAKSEAADEEVKKAKLAEIQKKRQALMTESGGKVAGAVIGLAGSIASTVSGVVLIPIFPPAAAALLATGYLGTSPSAYGVAKTAGDHDLLCEFLRENPTATEFDLEAFRAHKEYTADKQKRWEDSQKRWEEARDPKEKEPGPEYTSGRWGR